MTHSCVHDPSKWKSIDPGNVFAQECALCFVTPQYSSSECLFTCVQCHTSFCSTHLPFHPKFCKHPDILIKSTLVEAPASVSTDTMDASPADAEQTEPEYVRCVCCTKCNWSMNSTCDDTTNSETARASMEDYVHRLFAAELAVQEHQKIEAHHLSNPKMDCPHWVELPVEPSGKIVSNSTTCVECGLDGNNWLCLSCGYVGCGRKESGGQGHAQLHSSTNHHPVVLKLGTISKTDGTADVWCYACDDEIVDFSLQEHVLRYGIDVREEERSAKRLMELEYDMNGKYEFSRITGDETAEGISGPGYTGIQNIGNSCYFASALQVLFSTRAFHERYYMSDFALQHFGSCSLKCPIKCLSCQCIKMAHGLLSGCFPAKTRCFPSPRSMKRVLCSKHSEFRTNEQQDADEFIRYLMSELHREEMRVQTERNNSTANNTITGAPFITDAFKTIARERQVCSKCAGITFGSETHYTLSVEIPIPKTLSPSDVPHVAIEDCLTTISREGTIHRYCTRCQQSCEFLTQFEVVKFPRYLLLAMRRFTWDPTMRCTKKVPVCIDWKGDVLDLATTRAISLSPSDYLLPSTANKKKEATVKTVPVDELALVQLLSMGIDQKRAEQALRHTDNDVDRALDWMFSHEGETIEIDDASPLSNPTQEEQPVKEDIDQGSAEYKLLGLISHIGSNAHSGHYVAHVAKRDTSNVTQWIQFNDERVTVSVDPPKELAYLYLLERL